MNKEPFSGELLWRASKMDTNYHAPPQWTPEIARWKKTIMMHKNEN